MHAPSFQPFGYYALPGWAEALARLCHRLPANWLGRRLGFILRRPVIALKSEVVDLSVMGTSFRLYPENNLSDKRLLCTPNILDGDERVFLADSMAQGSWLIDVGANIGGYSLLLCKQRPDIRVLVIEPDPDMAARLQYNIELNGLSDRVRLAQVAITDSPATVELYRDPVNRGKNSLLQGGGMQQGDSIEVVGLPLHALFIEYQIASPEAIKLDIEGFELPVLRGFFESVDQAYWPRLIQIEQHRRQVELNDAVQLAMEEGYQIRLHTRMNVILERSPEH
ncbi:MAG: FkbM family methyltransferase [Chromatiales bacterium]|nr:FkbM family methyltransferase [Chromatiales bacterium]